MPGPRRLLLLLLDGVSYARMHALHARGLFRMFPPPTRLISVFPTLTDPAYDVLFGTGPTPAFEAGYFDRAANRQASGLLRYVRGANERWLHHCHFRLNCLEDGLMYLFPRAVFASELRRARRAFDRQWARGRSPIVLYILSTDALGHMLPTPEIERQLARLHAWLHGLLRDYPDALDVVMLADHGVGALAPQRGCVRPFDLPRAVRAAGLRAVRRLHAPGDVAISRFGLLDIARLFTADAATRDRVVAALRARPEVELVLTWCADTVHVCTSSNSAEVHSRPAAGQERTYAYLSTAGDPLELRAACAALREAGHCDADGFATARAWLNATAEHVYPAAPPRLWDGLFLNSGERPDVVLCLREEWFVGSGLFHHLVRMHGTHGGLHRRVSETFVMSTRGAIASPASLAEVQLLLQQEFNWHPSRAT